MRPQKKKECGEGPLDDDGCSSTVSPSFPLFSPLSPSAGACASASADTVLLRRALSFPPFSLALGIVRLGSLLWQNRVGVEAAGDARPCPLSFETSPEQTPCSACPCYRRRRSARALSVSLSSSLLSHSLSLSALRSPSAPTWGTPSADGRQ